LEEGARAGPFDARVEIAPRRQRRRKPGGGGFGQFGRAPVDDEDDLVALLREGRVQRLLAHAPGNVRRDQGRHLRVDGEVGGRVGGRGEAQQDRDQHDQPGPAAGEPDDPGKARGGAPHQPARRSVRRLASRAPRPGPVPGPVRAGETGARRLNFPTRASRQFVRSRRPHALRARPSGGQLASGDVTAMLQ
jgi:hypothetical protein